MLDWLTIKQQKRVPFIYFWVFSCWLHCHNMEDFFLLSCYGKGAKAFFGNATGFTSLLFSSAAQGRKTSLSRVV